MNCPEWLLGFICLRCLDLNLPNWWFDADESHGSIRKKSPSTNKSKVTVLNGPPKTCDLSGVTWVFSDSSRGIPEIQTGLSDL